MATLQTRATVDNFSFAAYQCDLNGSISQLACYTQAAKACTNNHKMRGVHQMSLAILATDCNLMPAAAKPTANINPATANSESSEGTKYPIIPTKTESDQSPTTQLGSTLASHSLIPRIIRPREKISDPAGYRLTPVMALLDLMTRMPTTAIKKPRKPNLPVSGYCTPYKAKMPRRINISVR